MNDLMIHVRFEGQSWDWPAHETDIGDGSTDAQIREACANRLNVPLAKLNGFAVSRTADGITLRPEAVFGR